MNKHKHWIWDIWGYHSSFQEVSYLLG